MPRIKAGANWSGAQWGDLMNGGFEQAFMGIDAVREPSVYPFMVPYPIIYGEAAISQLSYLQLAGFGHSNFSGMAYLTPRKFLSEAGPIDHNQSVAMINKLTLSFFNAHLLQQGKFLTGELKHPEGRLRHQK